MAEKPPVDLNQALDDGNVKGLLRGMVHAMRNEEQGVGCECPPDKIDVGGKKSYLCFTCGLYNAARKAEIEAAMRGPHRFEPRDALRLGGEDTPLRRAISAMFCDFCMMKREDPRHRTGGI